MRRKGPDQTVGRPQARARSACARCGIEAYTGKNACPATGRRCLRFARVCNQDKQANSVELEQEAKEHHVSQEQESAEEVYLYQVKEGKSQNPTVALIINGIPLRLHLDKQADVTVVTEQHYGKLQDKYTVQPIQVSSQELLRRRQRTSVTPARKVRSNACARREEDHRYRVRRQRSREHCIAKL